SQRHHRAMAARPSEQAPFSLQNFLQNLQHTIIRSLYIICGSRLNAPSQQAAEELALKSCQATRNSYKVTTGGGCEIAASK
ncbi:hypothetical protein NKI91_24945, partial [Mesorhizobium sp. M0312]